MTACCWWILTYWVLAICNSSPIFARIFAGLQILCLWYSLSFTSNKHCCNISFSVKFLLTTCLCFDNLLKIHLAHVKFFFDSQASTQSFISLIVDNISIAFSLSDNSFFSSSEAFVPHWSFRSFFLFLLLSEGISIGIGIGISLSISISNGRVWVDPCKPLASPL